MESVRTLRRGPEEEVFLTIADSSNIARGSLYETKHWLRRAYKRKLLTNHEVNDLKPVIDELLPTLNAYFRSLNEAVEKTRTKDKAQSTKFKN